MAIENRQLLSEAFPQLSAYQGEKLLKLQELLTSWNKQINLVSRRDIHNLLERHILQSLALSNLITFKAGTQLLDAGTGGGLPGLPLAIAIPQAHFHLVDSTRKKLNAVNEMAVELNIQNVSTEHQRLENLNGRFEFILGRAVSNLPQFLSWVKPLISLKNNHQLPNGIFYWKGGALDDAFQQEHPDYQSFMLENLLNGYGGSDKYIVYCPGS